MDKKYLLYIDILGFTELVKKNPAKISALYAAMDRLNVHKHYAFTTIVFSDTILVFNKVDPGNEDEHRYIVMYACEFARDLLMWCINLDIHFRAILLYGDFLYREMENIQSYYGNALIDAFTKEKEIVGMGLFISKNLLSRNKQFKTVSFDADYDFVFLTTLLNEVMFHSQGVLPMDRSLFDKSWTFTDLWREVELLKNLKKNIEIQTDSRIRAKYIQTFHLYKQRYGDLINQLEASDFDMKVFNGDVNWADVLRDNYQY